MTPGFFSKFAITAAMLGVTLAASALSERREPEPLVQPLRTIPLDLPGGWIGRDLDRLPEETEAVLNATSYVTREYTRDSRQIQFFVAFYAMQRAGETMHSPRNCLPGSGWEIWKYDTVTVDVDGEPVNINKYWIQRGRDRMVTYYWYQSGERVVANEYWAKACLVWDALARGRTSGAIVRLVLPDVDWAGKIGADFAAQIIPRVRATLPRG